LGEASSIEELKVRLFPLSLTGTELKLSHLTAVRKKHDESVTDYVKRFRDIKKRCYSLVITERDLADLVLNGLKTHIKERLESYEFLNINQVLQKALAQES